MQIRLPAPLQPLRRRLPILISALLLAVVAAFSWAAYHRFERALLAAGEERVGNASQRLAATLGESGRRSRNEWARVVSHSTIRRYLETGDENAASAARQTMQRWLDSIPVISAVEVRDITGASRLTLPSPERARDFAPLDSAWRRTALLPLQAVGDTIYYELRTAVHDRTRDTLGYVVVRRRLTFSAANSLISKLIGADATVLMGNRTGGSVWTDFAHKSPAPTTPITTGTVLTLADRDGKEAIGVATQIDGTPWVILVALPHQHVVAPARQLLGEMAGLIAIVLAAGALAAWLLSRQITRPLAEVTEAAAGIAAGDYSRRVARSGDDELGHLAAAFNSMASQVQESTRTLEHRVADRTHELQQALAELHAAQGELIRREREAGEARYRRLVETAHEGVWTVDRDQRTSYVNPRMAAMLGYTPDEMIGRSLFDFMHDDGREEAKRRVEKGRRGIADAQEVQLRHRDGTKLWGFISTSPILDECGSYTGSLAMVMDMTEHRKLQTHLRQAQKIEAVGQLAGGVAHDFNNLLTVIKGFTTFLLEDLPQDDPRRGDVRGIDEASDRAATLTRQLLAFSRRQILEPRLLDLNDIVGQFGKMIRRLVPADIEITTTLAPDLRLVEVDPGQVEQVLMNLAVNARDAMPDGGKLMIETSNAELDEAYAGTHVPVVPGQYVLLTVSDTGHGMDNETQARVFEPFFTTKEKGKGAGLGLPTVYGIVKQSGGYVWVYSEPGQGTTVRVYLPRASITTTTANGAATSAPKRRGAETILLVEDEASVRGVARRALDRHGYTVIEAMTGADALQICERSSESIDLIISDLVMPEMGGRELAAEVRARHPHVRMLFMSGYTEDAALRRNVLDPAEAFIGKPFTLDALTRKVRDVLDGEVGVEAPADAYARPTGQAHATVAVKRKADI